MRYLKTHTTYFSIIFFNFNQNAYNAYTRHTHATRNCVSQTFFIIFINLFIASRSSSKHRIIPFFLRFHSRFIENGTHLDVNFLFMTTLFIIINSVIAVTTLINRFLFAIAHSTTHVPDFYFLLYVLSVLYYGMMHVCIFIIAFIYFMLCFVCLCLPLYCTSIKDEANKKKIARKGKIILVLLLRERVFEPYFLYTVTSEFYFIWDFFFI